MSKVKKIADYILHPTKTVLRLAGMGYLPFISDERYLKLKFRQKMGYPLNLEHPRTFNEKLQWLKLHDRRPEYTTMVDKVAAKQWVADRIGEEHIIPTLGVWDDPDEIDFDALPDQFVLKCNHNSGLGMCICTDKSKLDIPRVKKELRKGLRQNYYLTGREWPYKDVPRKILAEQYMVDESGTELKDYKVFNFDGEPKLIQVDFDRFAEHKRNLYTTDWEYIEAAIEFPSVPERQFDRPRCLEKMLELAKKLAGGVPHLRTDFYCIDDRVYFGELTFYHGSGCERFEPAAFGIEVGSWLTLPSGGGIIKTE